MLEQLVSNDPNQNTEPVKDKKANIKAMKKPTTPYRLTDEVKEYKAALAKRGIKKLVNLTRSSYR